MENINILLNNSTEFEKAMKEGLPEGGDIAIYTNDNATQGGSAAAVITWTVQIPYGKMARAQAVTTIKLLKMALRIIDARYGDDGRPRAELVN